MSMEAAVSDVPSHVPAGRAVNFDFFNDPALKQDIFKRLAEVRASSPKVAYSPQIRQWMVFGQEEIQRILTDGDTFSSQFIGGGPDGPGMIPLGLDPPDHAPWRILLLKHFGPAQIRKLEGFVREWAEKLIDNFDHKGTYDFLKTVAEPMPVSVFMEIMGLSLDRFQEFRTMAATALTPPEDAEQAANQAGIQARIVQVLTELIADRKREPRDDLVSKILAEKVMDRDITDKEMMAICYLQFLAGLDTVTNAMTYGMRHLAQDPALQAQLRADYSLIPGFVERMLRLYTFVNTFRLVKQDTELDGVNIKQGELVFCVLWAGSNQEGGETEGPRHMAFGSGHHMCLGMHLARLELRVMYETWFDKIAKFKLAKDPNPKPAMRGGSVMNITRLLVDVTPKASA